jgi:glutaredoxin 3
MEKQITIYTVSVCPFCLQAKEYLRGKGLKFNEKDVEADREALEEMLELSGQHGVPVIVVNGEVVVGYNRTMLDTLVTDN